MQRLTQAPPALMAVSYRKCNVFRPHSESRTIEGTELQLDDLQLFRAPIRYDSAASILQRDQDLYGSKISTPVSFYNEASMAKSSFSLQKNTARRLLSAVPQAPRECTTSPHTEPRV